MRPTTLLILIVIVSLVTALSGCICCCGLDSLFSKMKKPVSDIVLPGELSAGGHNYSLLYSYDYLNRSAAKAGFKAFIPRIGYRPEDYGSSVDQMMDVGSVDQYKWFEYGNATGNVSAGGFLAKAGGPVAVSAGIQSMNMMLSSTNIANDPARNLGGARNLTRIGGTSLGDGGDVYRFDADYNGSADRDCYFVMDKYSNMYVAIYSFVSRDEAENITAQAIAWIDKAAG